VRSLKTVITKFLILSNVSSFAAIVQNFCVIFVIGVHISKLLQLINTALTAFIIVVWCKKFIFVLFVTRAVLVVKKLIKRPL
jgi:hypothetical protein